MYLGKTQQLWHTKFMSYSLRDSGLHALLYDGKSATLPKGQILQLSNERMLLNVIRSGYIKRYMITNDGSQSVQSVYGPDDVFPLTPVYKLLFDQTIYSGSEVHYYETITPAKVFSIDQMTLEQSVESDPALYRDLLYVAGTRLSSNIQRLENTSLKVANRKVAHQLYYYAGKFGAKTGENVSIMVPLTHQLLADILNLARETVTHCIVKLQEKELIRSEKNIITVDLQGLKQELN